MAGIGVHYTYNNDRTGQCHHSLVRFGHHVEMNKSSVNVTRDKSYLDCQSVQEEQTFCVGDSKSYKNMLLVALFFLINVGIVHSQCACATTDVHVRSGPGVHSHVYTTLLKNHCLTEKRNGVTTHADGYDWVNVDYNGKDGWIARNYVTLKACSSQGWYITRERDAKVIDPVTVITQLHCRFSGDMSPTMSPHQPCSDKSSVNKSKVGTERAHQTINCDVGSHHYNSVGTAYYPSNDPIEGGFVDMRGAPLKTLQDFLQGTASYVSVAMDNHAGIAYGTHICIPQLNRKYQRVIDFRVVDTGSAFYGKHFSRIDICVRTRHDSFDDTINNHLTLVFP